MSLRFEDGLGTRSSSRVWMVMLVPSITPNLLLPATGELATLPSCALGKENLGGLGVAACFGRGLVSAG
jgi:hypothetical protein